MGGPLCGVRIWHGAPKDPVDNSLLDRGWRWQAEANGTYIEIDRVWPRCGKDPIDRAEYDYLTALTDHAKAHDGLDPMGKPWKRVDWDHTPDAF